MDIANVIHRVLENKQSLLELHSADGAPFYFTYIYYVFETIQLRNVSNLYDYIELTCYFCFLLCWASRREKKNFLRKQNCSVPNHPNKLQKPVSSSVNFFFAYYVGAAISISNSCIRSRLSCWGSRLNYSTFLCLFKLHQLETMRVNLVPLLQCPVVQMSLVSC